MKKYFAVRNLDGDYFTSDGFWSILLEEAKLFSFWSEVKTLFKGWAAPEHAEVVKLKVINGKLVEESILRYRDENAGWVEYPATCRD